MKTYAQPWIAAASRVPCPRLGSQSTGSQVTTMLGLQGSRVL